MVAGDQAEGSPYDKARGTQPMVQGSTVSPRPNKWAGRLQKRGRSQYPSSAVGNFLHIISLTGIRYQGKDSGSGPYQMVKEDSSDKILPDASASRASKFGLEDNYSPLHQDGAVM